MQWPPCTTNDHTAIAAAASAGVGPLTHLRARERHVEALGAGHKAQAVLGVKIQVVGGAVM